MPLNQRGESGLVAVADEGLEQVTIRQAGRALGYPEPAKVLENRICADGQHDRSQTLSR
jgi:hypothetical protein